MNNYKKEFTELYDNAKKALKVDKYCVNADSFRVCLKGGRVVRNITLDGKCSPLFVAAMNCDDGISSDKMESYYLPNNDTASKPSNLPKETFDFPYFESSIESINQNTIILENVNDGYRPFIMSLSENDLLSSESIIEKKLTEKEPPIPIEIITSKEDDLALEEANKVIIEVTDLNKEESYLEALDKIIQLTQNIDAIKSGRSLRFRIKDKENHEEDAIFFEKAIKVEGAAEKMEQIVTNYIKYKEGIEYKDHLYIDDYTSALAYTVYHLVASNPTYIDTAMRYLRVMDFEHDVFNREKLIPLLKEKYHEEYGEQIIKKISKIDLDVGEYWLEVYEYHKTKK